MVQSTLGFGDQLAERMKGFGPLCVGIDPHPELLTQWGLDDSALGLEKFSEAVLTAAEGRVAAIKPQVAFFERHGSAGFRVLEDLLAEARKNQIMVVADAKRGDIGSTMKAYAESWLGTDSALGTDSVTVSPYLGFESLRPAMDLAYRNGRGIFALALTSNPEGASVQHVGDDAESVASKIITAAQAENAKQEFSQMGSCGLVIGATVGNALKKLNIDLSHFNGPVLAPGFGAQGAGIQELYSVFEGIESQVLVNSSRGILRHGPCVEGLIDSIELINSELKNVNN